MSIPLSPSAPPVTRRVYEELTQLETAINDLQRTVDEVEERCSDAARKNASPSSRPEEVVDIEGSNLAASIKACRLRIENIDDNLKSLLTRLEI